MSSFFFNDTATTEIYTLSLHDALPISATVASEPSAICVCRDLSTRVVSRARRACNASCEARSRFISARSKRSEEHTSELQSRLHLVCRLLLEKKKKNRINTELHSYSSK